MKIRNFIACPVSVLLVSLLLSACGSDSDSGNGTAAPSGLSQAGLEISGASADTPPTSGKLPDDLMPPE